MNQEIMPDYVVEDFRRMLGLTAAEPIPADLEDAYYAYRYMKDLCTAGDISVSELIVLAIATKSHGYGREAIRVGDRVETLFNGKERTGVVCEVCGGDEQGKARVKIDGDKMNYREVLLSDTKIAR